VYKIVVDDIESHRELKLAGDFQWEAAILAPFFCPGQIFNGGGRPEAFVCSREYRNFINSGATSEASRAHIRGSAHTWSHQIPI
jgi:hypothetical protein